MKYIKKFEKSNNKDKIQEIANYIQEFINQYYDNNVDYTSYNYDYAYDYAFMYTDIDQGIQRKYFMNLRLSTNEDYFLFDIDNIILNPGWINDKIENVSLFIKTIMDKYTEFNKIKCSEIDNIIKYITKGNYEIYLSSIKYNI